MKPWMFVATVTVLSLAASGGADEARSQAKRLFGQGEAKYRAGDYRGAIVEFQAADALLPSPALSYNIGVCHEKLGEDELALTRFRQFLSAQPDAPNRSQVEARILRLEEQIAARKVPPPPPGEDETFGLIDAEPPSAPPEPRAGSTTMGPGAKGGWVDPAAPPSAASVAQAPEGAPASQDPGIDEALSRRLPSLARPAEGSPGAAEAEAAPAPPMPAGVPDEPKSEATPVYKKWWFWLVIGVSAYVLYDVASDDSSEPGGNGAIIFSF